MENIQYVDILKRALTITWKNKFLWFFGFLVFLGSATSNLNVKSDSLSEQGKKVQLFSSMIQQNPKMFTFLGVIFILLAIALFLLRIMATAGMVKSLNDIDLYRQLSVWAILQQAKKYLGRLFLLELLVGGALVLVVVVLTVPVLYLFALKAKLLAFCALAFAIAIAGVLLILAYYLIKYASFYVILADEKLIPSLESAYGIFVKKIKESLLMGLVIAVVNMLLTTGILIVCAILAVVLFPLGFVVNLIFAKAGLVVFLAAAAILLVVMLGLIFSWYLSFLQAAWLFFFQKIALEKQQKEDVLEKMELEGKVPSPEVV